MGRQHRNNVIPHTLFHLHKGKGWRRGGRRRGKCVRARGSSGSSRQRIPAASTPAPTDIHPSDPAPLTFSRLKTLIWLMKANQSRAAALPCSRAGITEHTSPALLKPAAPSEDAELLRCPKGQAGLSLPGQVGKGSTCGT